MRHTSKAIAVMTLLSGLARADNNVNWPANLPDAGVLMRQNEQIGNPNARHRVPEVVFAPALAVTDATVITAKNFKFLGAKRLTPEQLTVVTDQFLNRALNQHDLHRLTDAVTARYRQSGWFVRVYIPQQDIDKSDISIQILENTPSSAR